MASRSVTLAKSKYRAWPIGTNPIESTVRVGPAAIRPQPRIVPVFRGRGWLVGLQQAALRSDAYLVPLRWFLGIGWLRSAVEKLIDPAWYSGDALRDFLGNVTSGAVVFPAFETLLQTVVEPAAPLVSWLVVALQLACGTGILLGRSTNAALLTGIGMNLAFMMAGVPNPSAFYVLIQLVLFNSDAGAIIGFDGRASAPERSLLVAARAEHRSPNHKDRWWLGGLVGALLVMSSYAFAHGTDFTPGGSVKDPALVLGMVTGLGGLMCLISLMRPAATFEVNLTERLAKLEIRR